jgi:hypothetical protein
VERFVKLWRGMVGLGILLWHGGEWRGKVSQGAVRDIVESRLGTDWRG